MKTLVVSNQKGGVGKTALAVSLAWDLEQRGLRIAVLDLDVQANASLSLGQYATTAKASEVLINGVAAFPAAGEGITLFAADNKLVTVENMEAGKIAANLRQGLEGLAASGYDVCIIDCPAAFGVRSMAGLVATDFVLAPIELEAYSLQGIKQLLATISNARKINPGLKFLGMLANKVDGRNPRHREHLEQLRTAYPKLLMPVTIGLRSSIAESLVTGEPVWKNKKTAARSATKELKAMAEFVAKAMGLA